MNEIEYRVKNVSKDIFMFLLHKYSKNFEYIKTEKTINTIYSNTDEKYSSIVNVKYYDEQTILTYKKKRYNQQYYNNYDINGKLHNILLEESKETFINFNYSTSFKMVLIRIKQRLIFKINDDWYIHMTCVHNDKELSNNNNTIVKFFDNFELYNKNFINDYIKTDIYIDSYEVEIENDPKNSMLFENAKQNTDSLLSICEIYKDKLDEMYNIMYNTDNSYYNHNRLSFRTFINQPISLNNQIYNEKTGNEKFNNWYITNKLDGERVLLYLNYKKLFLKFSRKNVNINLKHYNNYVIIMLDAEYYKDTVYVFDVLYFNEPVFRLSYTERIKLFDGLKKITNELSKDDVNIEYKSIDFINNNNAKTSLKELINKHYTNSKYKNDGLIFSSSMSDYYNTINIKWKPPENNSIDVYLKLIKFDNVKNKYEYHIYTKINFSQKRFNITHKNDYLININNGTYMIFKPMINQQDYRFYYHDKNLNEKIVEITKNLKTWEWVYVLTRTDKVDPNNYDTCESIYTGLYNPLTLEKLINPDFTDIYFKTYIKSDVKNWNNMVKYQLLKFIEPNKTILDLGSGRGNDYYKYINYNVNEIIFIDEDVNAFQDFVERRITQQHNKSNRQYQNAKKPNVYLILEDLKTDYDVLLKKIYYKTEITAVDYIVINMSIHYFTYTGKLTNNLSNLVSSLLKTGGFVFITMFDGKEVYNLLKENNGSWITDKYHIELVDHYSTKMPEYSNYMKIKVKLPFSNEELYEEHLIDVDHLILTINKTKKFTTRLYKKFSDFNDTNNLTNKLTEDDKIFIKLYSAIILEIK